MKNQQQSSTPPLFELYQRMLEIQGHQGWWPGETPFEVCVGAILTQNTAWKNVERAMERLKRAGVLSPTGIYELQVSDLADLIRPAGCANVKAGRLRAFVAEVVEKCGGRLERLFQGGMDQVRDRLLAIKGVGPETADCMLLYAGGHASFVVDAYTRRIFSRHGWCNERAGYDEIQALCSTTQHGPTSRDERVAYWQDYHAQIVAVGKDFCWARAPRCGTCPLKPYLAAPCGGRGTSGESSHE